jgi:CheY-like chemotaxis protein
MDVSQQLAGMRILVAEDHPVLQQVAAELLSIEGAEVMLAANGRLAVEAIAAADPPFDAVLLDLHMPDMDGFAAVDYIRRALKQTALPVIAMTANASEDDRQACLAAGMDDHVGKPFDLPALVALLLRHTGRGSGQSSSPKSDFDLRGALCRVGDRTAYAELLEIARPELGSVAERLRECLAAERWTEAGQAVHTVKGLAATLGMGALADQAADIEQRLTRAHAGSRAEARAFAETLAPLTAALERAAQTALCDADAIATPADVATPDAVATLAAVAAPVHPESAARSLEPATAPDADRRKSVLVVDDHPLNIRVLHRALSPDYRVFMATCGEQALEKCRDDPPDLVLLDVVMPVLDGYEVCKRLKADPATRGIPVIFVTGHRDPVEEARGLELGALAFITKPIEPAEVRARVKNCLDATHHVN